MGDGGEIVSFMLKIVLLAGRPTPSCLIRGLVR